MFRSWKRSAIGLSLRKRATITQSYRKKTDFNSIPKDFFSQHLKKKNFLLCNNNSSGASSNLIINCIYHWVALFLRDKLLSPLTLNVQTFFRTVRIPCKTSPPTTTAFYSAIHDFPNAWRAFPETGNLSPYTSPGFLQKDLSSFRLHDNLLITLVL